MLYPRLILILLLALAGGCTYTTTGDGSAQLYADLGRDEGITRIVDEFLYGIGDDPRIIDLFADTDIDRFREKLTEQLCEVSGGPCRYSGDTMAESHRGLGIDDSHFNALVEDLVLAMQRAGTSISAQNRLLARLAPMHAEIVER